MMRPVGNEFAKMPLQIATHFGTHILVDGKRSRCVLDEEVQYADVDFAELRELRHHFIGDHVKATTAWLQPDHALNPGHEEIISGGGMRVRPHRPSATLSRGERDLA